MQGGDNYVRIARENIDLKSKVGSLEVELDQLRSELQKTHIHQHILQGGGGGTAAAARPSSSSSSPSTPPPPQDVGRSTDATAALHAEIQRLHDQNDALTKKLDVKSLEVESTKQVCEKRIWQLQHEFELLSQQQQSSAAKEAIPAVAASNAAAVTTDLIYQKKWDPSSAATPSAQKKDEEDANTNNGNSLLLQGEIDGLKAALEALQLEATEERSKREEAEMMLEFVQNELADTQQQLADAATDLPPADDEDDDDGPPPPEDDDEDLAPPSPRGSSGTRYGQQRPKKNSSGLSPSPSASRRSESMAFLEDNNAKIEEIVEQRLEEEKYLIEVDHEDALNGLRLEIEAKDVRIKELSLELGRQQLTLKKRNSGLVDQNTAASPRAKDAPLFEDARENMWKSPTKRPTKGISYDDVDAALGGVTQEEYDTAVAKMRQAEMGKEQALKQVAELSAKLQKLASDSKREKQAADKDSNWAEKLLAQKDAEVAEAQSQRLDAEAELAIASSQLAGVHDKYQIELGKLNNAHSILEREIQDLKRDRDQANQRAQMPGAKNALLLSKRAQGGGGSGIKFGRAGGGDSSLNSSQDGAASGVNTPTTPPTSKPKIKKAPLRERLLQKQNMKSKSGGGGGGAEAPVSTEEKARCVDGAADKADMIVGRLARMMLVGTSEYHKAPRHWDPSSNTNKSSSEATGAGDEEEGNTMSDETKDALAEMLAEALIDYEFALSQLRNEVLSLRTIVTMTESDVREEYQGRLSRMEDEMGNLRAAAQLHDEERSKLHQQQRARQSQQQ